jgi:DNA polymerase-4
MQKPNGLVIIEQTELPQNLFGLMLRALNGIDHSMEMHLGLLGIHTVERLCMAPAWQLQRAWRGAM